VLNEPGPDISEEAWQRYELAVLDELNTGRHRTLVCTGSLPPGVPDDAYGRLTVIGHRAGVRVVVDTSRAALAASLSFGPDLITPNLSEAEHAVHGHPDATVDEADPGVRERAAQAVRELCARGAKSAAVTVGAAGTAFGTSETIFWIPTVEVEVANPIGAGDSFVGGLVEAWESGKSHVDSVVFGVATATASVEKPVAGEVDVARARELAAHLTATPIPGFTGS
jgi:fructose-1-phosphate kinase PfkB-like protein